MLTESPSSHTSAFTNQQHSDGGPTRARDAAASGREAAASASLIMRPAWPLSDNLSHEPDGAAVPAHIQEQSRRIIQHRH